MNSLKINSLPVTTVHQLDEISVLLDNLERHTLSHYLWKKLFVKPRVNFTIGYNATDLFVKFYVLEPYIRAVFRNPNEPVYQDSCVELFISFGDDENYYNLEFNCMGTCLGQYGKNKADRKFIAVDLLNEIKAKTHITNANQNELYEWELALKIPFSVFNTKTRTLQFDSSVRVNFYKCGDELEEPHFIAWNPIHSGEPNFHLPAFFGSASFENKA
ncbi:carbohydrate-binding family 9-like protein [Pedobacter sp. Du54]|uniref:carbohydrate-binding family 9-like protein n=1 Tax=Pedobacter anseongensis TaxID=3133439 RepID=UPI0030B11926